MIKAKINFDLDNIYQYLLIALAFIFPLTVAGGNLIVGIIVLLWIFSGNYRIKFNQVIRNKLAIFSMLFFSLHVVGLLWTEDLEWGLVIVKKMWYFLLLLPILLTITKKEYTEYYILSFLFAMVLTVTFSYLVWFEIIEPFYKATVDNPVITMSHVSYNIYIAFTIHLISSKFLFEKDMSKLGRITLIFLIIAFTVNLFITGGRSGQIMYFFSIALLIMQYYNKQKIKALMTILIIIPVVFFIAFSNSKIFHYRLSNALTNIQATYEENRYTSVGERMTFIKNSIDIIESNFLIGVGTGDFPNEYKKALAKNTPLSGPTENPHNMYLLVMVQLGIAGLISFLAIFYTQIIIAMKCPEKLIRSIGISLPLMYLLIMFGDSYLLGHYTTLLFIFFSSFLYNDFEKS
jgi:O-antigen ligase